MPFDIYSRTGADAKFLTEVDGGDLDAAPLPITLRRGTTAERNASNPILAAGEPAVVLDSGQPAELVLGDGVTAMADLRAAVWDDDARLALAGTATQPGDLGTAAATDATDYLTGVGRAALTTRVLNGDDNVLLTLGTGQAITDPTHQTYIATITPTAPGTATVTTTGALAAGIGFNIGQWIVRATDGASNLTRTGEFCNIEHDFIQFEQTGGTAIFNRVVSSRFRFSIPKTGVTIVDNKGIDFVVPNAGDVTGSVTNYIAINIPALTAGGGTNFYGIKFNNEPNGGSIAAQNADLVFKTLTNGQHIKMVPAPGGGEVRVASAVPTVRIMPTGRGDKTFSTSSSSPKDVLEITSVGPTGGWHGVIDLKVSNSAGAAFSILRLDGAGTATGAVGFFGVTPSGQRATTANATDLATAITLVNALKADLQAFGLKA